MDRNEAKLILGSLRPDGQDDASPEAKQAFALLENDEELKTWFEEQRAFDKACCCKLREAPVPEGLRESILACQKASVLRPSFQWRRWAALAAAVVLLLAVSLVNRSQHTGFEEFRGDMVSTLNGLSSLDMRSSDVREIRQWLAAGKGPADFTMPGRVEQLQGFGCKVLDWNGRKVTLICFQDSSNPIYDKVHLLVINRSDLGDAPPEDAPVFASQDSIVTASWSQGEHSYILAGHGSDNFLGKYF